MRPTAAWSLTSTATWSARNLSARISRIRRIFSRVRRRRTTRTTQQSRSPITPRILAASNYGPDVAGASTIAMKADVERLQKENPDAVGPVPDELVTTSASGLDPHLSPQAALWQVPRVAKARGQKPESVELVVKDHIESPHFRAFGRAAGQRALAESGVGPAIRPSARPDPPRPQPPRQNSMLLWFAAYDEPGPGAIHE